jgi:serine/threonine protein kinase
VLATLLRNQTNGIAKRGIAHRDLKAENIFICGNGMPKLGDFGSAVPFLSATGEKVLRTGWDGLDGWGENRVLTQVSEVQGTEVYLPPEASEQSSGPYHADVADIWQLAILYVAMSIRKFPWETASPYDEGFRAFLHNPQGLLAKLPPRSRDLIGRMLEIDPSSRATWNEIYDDRWVERFMNASRS